MESKFIIHRDIKPENILFQDYLSNDTPYLVDFGLSTYFNISKYLFTRCGTPGFVAPEIVNNPNLNSAQQNSKVDVFSVGVIMHSVYYSLIFINILLLFYINIIIL